jgi:hypothetical protein
MDENYYENDNGSKVISRIINFNLSNDKSQKFFSAFGINTKEYNNVGHILNQFDEMIKFTNNIHVDNDFEPMKDIDLDDYLETNTFFCSFNGYQIGDKNIYILGEMHGFSVFEKDREEKLLGDIIKLLNFDIDIAFFEFGVQHSCIGRLFNLVISKRTNSIYEYDPRMDFKVKSDLYDPNHKFRMKYNIEVLLKNFEPIFYDQYYKNLCNSIMTEILKQNSNHDYIKMMLHKLEIFLYDLSNLENLIRCDNKNIFLYCGDNHAENIGKLIHKYNS